MGDLTVYLTLKQDLENLINELKGDIMTARDDVAAIATQLSKAKDEILAKIADLETAINEGTVTAADLQPLRDTAQALDDVVPDQG